MEKEISSGTMLGIVLIALAAVIGLGFGVFSIAKGVANEGTTNVQDNLGTVSESAFEDYNDKIVTGTMVKSAVTTFQCKSVGILINTTAMDKEVKPYANHETIRVYKVLEAGESTMKVEEVSGSAANIGDMNALKGTGGNSHYYINYGALFSGGLDAESNGTGNDIGGDGTISLKDGIYNAKQLAFAVDPANGKVLRDDSVGGFGRTGNCEYLAPTAKFTANLIKDEAGTTIGIVFTQNPAS